MTCPLGRRTWCLCIHYRWSPPRRHRRGKKFADKPPSLNVLQASPASRILTNSCQSVRLVNTLVTTISWRLHHVKFAQQNTCINVTFDSTTVRPNHKFHFGRIKDLHECSRNDHTISRYVRPVLEPKRNKNKGVSNQYFKFYYSVLQTRQTFVWTKLKLLIG